MTGHLHPKFPTYIKLNKAVEVLIDGGVGDVRVKLGGLHANSRVDVEVGLLAPDEGGEPQGQQYVQRERRFCIQASIQP